MKKVLITSAIAVLVILLVSGCISPQADLNQVTPQPKVLEKNVTKYVSITTADKIEDAIVSFDGQSNLDEKTDNEITVYNDDLALVKEKRTMKGLASGYNLVKVKDVAERIDATSVLFKDLTDPNSMVLEQNYEYDLVSRNKLLEKFLDKQITVDYQETDSKTTRYTGKLLSYYDGILLDTEDGVISLSNINKISFPVLPEGLLTKPTLVWQVYTEKAGDHNTEISYLTSGFDWKADYIAELNKDDDMIDLKGWVTIENTSGTSYPNTALKLVAGEVNRVYDYPTYDYDMVYESAGSKTSADARQFEEESLFEYHLYTLGRKTTLNNNQTKQISLLSAESVPVKKELIYNGGDKVKVYVKFDNTKENNVGMPLPKGKVRMYKRDSAGSQQFLGEDRVDHTPENEDVELFIGNSFDVTGKRTQTDSQQRANDYYRVSYKIELKNAKDTAQVVTIEEPVYTNFEIISSSDDWEKKDAYTIQFKVTVPPKGSKTVSYTADYRYY